MSKPADVLDDLFADIAAPSAATSTNPTTTSTGASSNPAKSEKDLLAELDLLTADRPTTSRPSTPRGTIRKSLESRRPNIQGYGINTNLTRRDSSDVNSKLQTPIDSNPPTFAVTSPAGVSTPPPSSTPSRNPHPPQPLPQPQPQQESGGGGWWGSIFTTATTALTTAQNTLTTTHLQDHLPLLPSEQAQRWRSQATTLLTSAQTELRSRALPTLSNLLHQIAPPIASHEQLRIHITHDIQNYPSIDTIVYGVFDRVMQQVEGGDLLVVQKGKEAKPRSSLAGGATGWAGGPWYKSLESRNLNPLIGVTVEEGVKLARVAAEGYALEYTSSPSYIADQDSPNPNNPTRKSDIFLSIQPITNPAPAYLIPPSPLPSTSNTPTVGEDVDGEEDLTTFALHLHDPTHAISYSTLSQSIPARWFDWIDSPPHTLHADITAIVEEGGVDPREWVVEWVEETLGLAVGVVAQRYVAKRMNVGAGVVEGKGKEREVVSASVGGGGGEVGI
ncbi:maintenance of telomere capping protein 1 [Tirmania nivea]|nr:maintenance of telomere capping protein 1 [Tirmania nivea]